MLLTVGACWTRFRAGAYSFGSLWPHFGANPNSFGSPCSHFGANPHSFRSPWSLPRAAKCTLLKQVLLQLDHSDHYFERVSTPLKNHLPFSTQSADEPQDESLVGELESAQWWLSWEEICVSWVRKSFVEWIWCDWSFDLLCCLLTLLTIPTITMIPKNTINKDKFSNSSH